MAYAYLVQSTQQTGDILLLTLVPKSRHKQLVFTAGQYAAISFLRGGRPTPMRCFSITSSPSSGVLQFGMRVKGGFTQAAAGLAPGDAVQVQGPFGEFTIDPEYDRKVVMLAGGIGITPFVSILRDATERELAIPMTLLFANRSAANIPFQAELRELQRRNPNLLVRFYCADATPGDTGMVWGNITDEEVRQLVRGEHVGSTYFVCGPKGFSDGMRAALRAGWVHESRIISETFTQAGSLGLGSGFSVQSLTYGLAAVALVVMIGLVATLDLSRTVPKLASAQAAAQPSTSVTQSTSNDDSNGSASSAAPTPTPPSQSQQPAYNSYQPPMSSVS